jgi:hypothetical protein
MTQEKENKVCPTCEGKKIIPGVCECNSEWRANAIQSGGEPRQGMIGTTASVLRIKSVRSVRAQGL